MLGARDMRLSDILLQLDKATLSLNGYVSSMHGDA
jgi:hypothetical protein